MGRRNIRCASCTATRDGAPLNEDEAISETRLRLCAELGGQCPRGEATKQLCPMRAAARMRREEYA